MNTQGGQPGNGSHHNGAGRRLRAGVGGTVAVGAMIFMAGLGTAITASAHSGSVTASETCTTWTAAVSLENNVTKDRIVDVVVTPSSLAAGITGLNIDTTHNSGATEIWSANGTAPATGTFTLNIYQSVNNQGIVRIHPAEFTASAGISPPTNCATTPSISTTPAGTSVPLGTAIHDVATVTGTAAAGSPTGTVTFRLYGPTNQTCTTDGPAAVFTSAPIGLVSGELGISNATGTGFTPGSVGTYHWVASYSGDDGVHYKPVASRCADEAVIVSQLSPGIVTTPSNGGAIGVALSDTATVSGGSNPTGSVTFVLYAPNNPTCNTDGPAPAYKSPPEELTDGRATSGSFTTTAASGAGTYQWVAMYSGDAQNRGVTSNCTDEAVVVSAGGTGSSPTPTPVAVVVTTPSTGTSTGVAAMTLGGFLMLGGLGFALLGNLAPRRREI